MQDLDEGRLGEGGPVKAAGYVAEQAERLLDKGLRRLGRNDRDLQTDRKLAEWKVALAASIKQQCGASNRWFSETMHMGSIYSISKALAAQLRKKVPGKEWQELAGAPKSKA